uniref:Divalent anion:Na symporter (DASS) family protein pu n=1 Tax=Albugo laibachii Nc14 TaxID=890382 RepID=F0WBX5_9STRA|nr:divalent anion:Na symporter (DASS) family protein pu [Albugo laibachii Nc14]|eukprot:CCA18654.1 divalent anion:Na symporter (DASS) family protein pu [Albugo laibachii Nc14]
MKFGKVLENNANSEWRENYVQYKRLKRLIKRVAFEIEKKAVQQQRRASTALAIDTSSSAGPASTLGKIISKSPIFGKRFIPNDQETQPLFPSQAETVQRQRCALPLQKDYSDEDMMDAKNDFWNVLDENLKTVNEFYIREITSLRKTIKSFEEDISQEKQSHGHVHARCSVEYGFAALHDTYDILTDIKTFVQTNYTGFRKIVKKASIERHPFIILNHTL